MSINDKLAIYLITYNRKQKLEETLDSIFSVDSPIKDFDITILDNASTDGSSELIEAYCANYPNVKHIRHNINIGGNANICRAFEMGASSGKEYFGVLCDDDKYDWANWGEVETAIAKNKYDLIYTALYILRNKSDIAQLVHQATFVPACIYRTKRISNEEIQNMYSSICTMFPQVMVFANLICSSSNQIYIPEQEILIRGVDGSECDSTIIRGREKAKVFPYSANIFWHIGFIKAAQIISDKKKRDYVIQKVRFTDIFDQSFLSYMIFVVNYNKKYKKGNLQNIFDLFFNINFPQKIALVSAYLLCYTIFLIVYIYKNQWGYLTIKLFNCLKIRIYNKKWFEKIFSLRNSNDKKQKILTILGLKFCWKRK